LFPVAYIGYFDRGIFFHYEPLEEQCVVSVVISHQNVLYRVCIRHNLFLQIFSNYGRGSRQGNYFPHIWITVSFAFLLFQIKRMQPTVRFRGRLAFFFHQLAVQLACFICFFRYTSQGTGQGDVISMGLLNGDSELSNI
jgi:hypothetical protein